MCFSDAELIDRIKIDDKSAFSTIYNRYWEKLYLLAYTILKDNHAAEDIVQDVMISFWTRRNEIEIDNINSYLYQCVRFQVFKLIKKNKNMLLTPVSEIDLVVFNPAESNFQLEYINRSLLNVVEKLPARCREVFLLRRVKDLSIKEISEKLGISPKTVENQLTIALKRIRASINESSEQTLLFILFIYCY